MCSSLEFCPSAQNYRDVAMQRLYAVDYESERLGVCGKGEQFMLVVLALEIDFVRFLALFLPPVAPR